MIEIKHCDLCPKLCGADRTKTTGLCGGGGLPKLARAALHHWEEPCISGTYGSGAVFFSGCSMCCCYCQNAQISAENFGKEVDVERLAEIFLNLQEEGAHNLNLVSGSHYTPWVIEALKRVRPALHIPVVWNSSGYERVETLRALEGYVQIYLPDFKYADDHRAETYSKVKNYFSVTSQAIQEMFRQVGKPVFQGDLLEQGLVIRHLVLPGGMKDSMAVLDWLAEAFGEGEFLLSLMSQYTPAYYKGEYKELTRRVSTYEYNRVLSHAQKLGLSGFMQERDAAKEEYTPPFNLEGI